VPVRRSAVILFPRRLRSFRPFAKLPFGECAHAGMLGKRQTDERLICSRVVDLGYGADRSQREPAIVVVPRHMLRKPLRRSNKRRDQTRIAKPIQPRDNFFLRMVPIFVRERAKQILVRGDLLKARAHDQRCLKGSGVTSLDHIAQQADREFRCVRRADFAKQLLHRRSVVAELPDQLEIDPGHGAKPNPPAPGGAANGRRARRRAWLRRPAPRGCRRRGRGGLWSGFRSLGRRA
jgi:hypothetical protein